MREAQHQHGSVSGGRLWQNHCLAEQIFSFDLGNVWQNAGTDRAAKISRERI